MGYVFAGGAALLGILILYQVFRKTETHKLMRGARWVVGWGLALLSAFLIVRGQIGIATLTAPAAFAILKFGKIGPIDFTTTEPSPDNRSSVRARYVAMVLDHASGEVAGKVIFGAFKGRDLSSLGEQETRRLLQEIAGDPDSLSLLETWLDRNRAGWREWFAEQDAQTTQQNVDPDAEAYEILGLKPGASDEEIRAAHRSLMMKLHPDQGGSNYLATKINAAKDRLLKKSMT